MGPILSSYESILSLPRLGLSPVFSRSEVPSFSTDSGLKPGQYTIQQCHMVPKCDNWCSSHGLIPWFQGEQGVLCYNQILHGGIHMLEVSDLYGSCGEGLKSRLLVSGINPTI